MRTATDSPDYRRRFTYCTKPSWWARIRGNSGRLSPRSTATVTSSRFPSNQGVKVALPTFTTL
jgi:hypothetical protein